MVRMNPPSSPGFGGTTETGPNDPLMLILTEKTPLVVLLMSALFAAPPVVPLEYLNPSVPTGLQPAAGSENVWSESVPPFAITLSDAPALVGSPTTVLGLLDSLPRPLTFRLLGTLPGLRTTNFAPRTVWSVPSAGLPA